MELASVEEPLKVVFSHLQLEIGLLKQLMARAASLRRLGDLRRLAQFIGRYMDDTVFEEGEWAQFRLELEILVLQKLLDFGILSQLVLHRPQVVQICQVIVKLLLDRFILTGLSDTVAQDCRQLAVRRDLTPVEPAGPVRHLRTCLDDSPVKYRVVKLRNVDDGAFL